MSLSSWQRHWTPKYYPVCVCSQSSCLLGGELLALPVKSVPRRQGDSGGCASQWMAWDRLEGDSWDRLEGDSWVERWGTTGSFARLSLTGGQANIWGEWLGNNWGMRQMRRGIEPEGTA